MFLGSFRPPPQQYYGGGYNERNYNRGGGYNDRRGGWNQGEKNNDRPSSNSKLSLFFNLKYFVPC